MKRTENKGEVKIKYHKCHNKLVLFICGAKCLQSLHSALMIVMHLNKQFNLIIPQTHYLNKQFNLKIPQTHSCANKVIKPKFLHGKPKS